MTEANRHRIAAEVLAMLATMHTTTPAADQVVAGMGRDGPEVPEILRRLERNGLLESWPDPDRVGHSRVMLSGRSAARLGLRLSPRGDRWERPAGGPWPATLNPRRPRRR